MVSATAFLAICLTPLTLCTANDSPILGALIQEVDPAQASYGKYYLPASYVKFIEQAGARVVPVLVDQPMDYYLNLTQSINGVLFPGGSVDLTTSLYAQAAKEIYRLARLLNDKGSYFPLWGTCQGLEEMTTFPTGENMMSNCTGTMNILLPLDFHREWYESRLFSALPRDILAVLASKNVTVNLHEFCLSLKTYSTTQPLNDFFRIITTNKDSIGLTFISTMEARHYPFYAVQFHPEKNNFWWQPGLQLDHSADGVAVSQALANFLVSEARKSEQRFPNDAYAQELLIDNYPLTVTNGIAMYYFN